MMRALFAKNRKSDSAISPVIGTILMVAATVIVAGAVYAAINAYSGRANKQTTDAAFRAQAVDADGDGAEDTIKITYLTGPSGASTIVSAVKVATNSTSVAKTGSATLANPGDFITYPSYGAGGYFVTVTLGDTTYVDQTLQLKE